MALSEEFCIEHIKQLKELHEEFRTLNQYIPKIDAALDKLCDLKEVIKGHSEIHKELFKCIREFNEHLNLIKLDHQDIKNKVVMLEEIKNNAHKDLYQIIKDISETAYKSKEELQDLKSRTKMIEETRVTIRNDINKSIDEVSDIAGKSKEDVQNLQSRLKTLEESREGVLKIISPVASWILIALIAGIFILLAMNHVTPISQSTISTKTTETHSP